MYTWMCVVLPRESFNYVLYIICYRLDTETRTFLTLSYFAPGSSLVILISWYHLMITQRFNRTFSRLFLYVSFYNNVIWSNCVPRRIQRLKREKKTSLHICCNQYIINKFLHVYVWLIFQINFYLSIINVIMWHVMEYVR